jgi:hypothetical protein
MFRHSHLTIMMIETVAGQSAIAVSLPCYRVVFAIGLPQVCVVLPTRRLLILRHLCSDYPPDLIDFDHPRTIAF